MKTIGMMLDCSRNAVMAVPQLKAYMSVLARMGYNQVQLYMEDTYEVDGEPFFGHFRGRYTQAELKELDDYAYSIGIELVPCMQTLAHLNALVRWPKYEVMVDDADILLAGDERTYALIDNMLSSLRRCLRTDKIHIGMDEAHRLGKGRYRDLHGERDRFTILLEHLNRVCELTRKYGFQPMMWSDMFYRIANGGEYYARGAKFDAAIKAAIPEDVTLVYWDYYHTDKKTYTQMLRGHKQLCDRVVFAGGAWKWDGFAPQNAFSLRATKPAIAACVEEGVDSLLMTTWGDNGAEASPWSVLPVLCYAACAAQGITDMASIKAKFADCGGCAFDDFMLLDLPNRLTAAPKFPVNPSKYQLYNDCFMGILDTACGTDDTKRYASYARRLKNAARRTGEYAYLFDTASKLCATLALKADIGVRTRTLYASGDREALEPLVTEYTKLIKRTEVFYTAFRTQWYHDNKPQGFEVHDVRLGGLLMRLKDCRDRLRDYVSGAVESLPELEEPMLTFPYGDGITSFNYWSATVTANCL